MHALRFLEDRTSLNTTADTHHVTGRQASDTSPTEDGTFDTAQDKPLRNIACSSAFDNDDVRMSMSRVKMVDWR